MAKKKEQSIGEMTRAALKEFGNAVVDLICQIGKPLEDFKLTDDPDATNVAKGYTKEEVKAWKEYAKKPKRARTKTGTYRADDRATKEFNEAWVDGKAPKPKRRKALGTKNKTKQTKK
jgi:hypothetical protein